ncbi:MAG: hypothetical protein HC902_11075 [Calothrix sp. SM1_5_4]|nr:hypothetical protein [Calothrix sp. SM1_5_4]
MTLALLTGAPGAWGLTSSSTTVSSTTYSRGSFSLQAGYGYEENKLLNQDNSSSRFTGNGTFLRVDTRLWGAGPGEFRLSGSAKLMETKDSVDHANTINSDTYAGGVKVFTTSWLYLGGGLGAVHQRMRSASADVVVTNQYYYAEAGLEIPLFSSIYLGLSGIAQVNPIRKTSPMASHSVSDGFGAFLMLIYSPPNLSITNLIPNR